MSRCVISPLIAKSRLLEAAAETPEATAGGWRHAQLPGFNMFFPRSWQLRMDLW
jgi:hypothetical protein